MTEAAVQGLIGKRMPRAEDARLLTGRGTFVVDVELPGMLQVAFVRSSIARGRIRSIDVPKASIRRGEVWPGGGADAAASTPGESSTGPGIIRRGVGALMAKYRSSAVGGLRPHLLSSRSETGRGM